VQGGKDGQCETHSLAPNLIASSFFESDRLTAITLDTLLILAANCSAKCPRPPTPAIATTLPSFLIHRFSGEYLADWSEFGGYCVGSIWRWWMQAGAGGSGGTVFAVQTVTRLVSMKYNDTDAAPWRRWRTGTGSDVRE